MRTLRLMTCLALLPAASALCADPAPCAVPIEVGQTVEIALAKPYRTAEGVRIEMPWGELAGKDLLTLAAGGRERTLGLIGERSRVRGRLTAVNDAWLTLDLGEKQPLLRIPRAAIVRWETLGLAARSAEPLPTGQRIRVISRDTELGGQLLAGRLLAIDDETLLLKVDDRAQPIRLRRASIGQIEVSRGKRTGAGKGALIGGVSAGTVLALSPDLCFDCRGSDNRSAGGRAGAVLLIAGIGAGIGALIGSASKSERWERVPLSVAVAPQRRGGRAALTLRF